MDYSNGQTGRAESHRGRGGSVTWEYLATPLLGRNDRYRDIGVQKLLRVGRDPDRGDVGRPDVGSQPPLRCETRLAIIRTPC